MVPTIIHSFYKFPFSSWLQFANMCSTARTLKAKELTPSNCGAGEDSWKVSWTARRSNQSILINSEYSLEGLMLKLKLHYFGYLMQRANSLEKTLMLEKTEGGRRRGRQRMTWLDGITDSMDTNLSKVWEMKDMKPGGCRPWGCKESDTTQRLSSNENPVRAARRQHHPETGGPLSLTLSFRSVLLQLSCTPHHWRTLWQWRVWFHRPAAGF